MRAPKDISDLGSIKNVIFNGVEYTTPTMFFKGSLFWKIAKVELLIPQKDFEKTLKKLKKGAEFFFLRTVEASGKVLEDLLCEIVIENVIWDTNSKSGFHRVICKVSGGAAVEIAALKQKS